jgi:hypothetical protein
MLTDPIQTAQNAALAAIARLADAGHRLANEHAYALDQLRQENEALRRQNQALRERVAELEHRCEHTAEVREVVRTEYAGHRALCGVGGDFHAEKTTTRSALDINGRWWLFRPLESVSFCDDATEAQAIAWVLDGVLP